MRVRHYVSLFWEQWPVDAYVHTDDMTTPRCMVVMHYDPEMVERRTLQDFWDVHMSLAGHGFDTFAEYLESLGYICPTVVETELDVVSFEDERDV